MSTAREKQRQHSRAEPTQDLSCWGWTVVEALTFHVKVPGVQLPAQEIGFLKTGRITWIEFLAPGFGFSMGS